GVGVQPVIGTSRAARDVACSRGGRPAAAGLALGGGRCRPAWLGLEGTPQKGQVMRRREEPPDPAHGQPDEPTATGELPTPPLPRRAVISPTGQAQGEGGRAARKV